MEGKEAGINGLNNGPIDQDVDISNDQNVSIKG